MIKPSGRSVAGALTGGKAAIAWLTPKGGATSLVLRLPAKIQPDGTFSFADVAPGAYLLNATEADGVTSAAAPVSVTVLQKDLDGITLHAQAGSELEGDVALGTNEIALPPGIQIILETADAPLPRPVRTTVDAKGKFRIPVLPPGRYLLHVLAPEGLFVRSAKYRGADLLNEPFDFGGAPAPMLIQLSASGASAGGSVRGADGSPIPGATVALVPTLHRLSRFKEVTTDQFGEYHFDGIAPGDYRIYAFDHITPGQYEDAQWMKKYEFKGQPLTAKSGGKETIPLKALE
jgi:hypothetical protein